MTGPARAADTSATPPLTAVCASDALVRSLRPDDRAVLALMALGLPVALAFIATNILGALLFLGGERGIAQLINGTSALTSFALAPVPLFLLMGELFFHTGLARRVFDAIDRLLGRVPARLSFVTVAGGTAFAALSGSSMA